jgi:hypothetical protein
VDETDNIADARSPSTPHCGAIEGKVLRGSDGRDYVLEVMRLTPRDANYVLGEKGTGKVALAAKADKDLAVTYLLRRELVELFVQSKLNAQRQAVMLEAQAKQKQLLAEVTPAPVAEGENPKVNSNDSDVHVGQNLLPVFLPHTGARSGRGGDAQPGRRVLRQDEGDHRGRAGPGDQPELLP